VSFGQIVSKLTSLAIFGKQVFSFSAYVMLLYAQLTGASDTCGIQVTQKKQKKNR
jgi:hypothetical protein